MIANLKTRLSEHPIFSSMRDVESLRIFMEHHVLCVWDFMLLVKSLQHDFCPTDFPWTPPPHPEAARLINQIVLGEESDLDLEGLPASHCDIYIKAMNEVGCHMEPITDFLAKLRRPRADNTSGLQACYRTLKESTLPQAAKRFTTHTLSVLEAPLHVRLGVFFHSREALIPEMFTHFIKQLHHDAVPCANLLYYLTRHVEVDAHEHGPMAERLLDLICDQDPTKKKEAYEAACLALQVRMDLWDTIHVMLNQRSITGQHLRTSEPASTRNIFS